MENKIKKLINAIKTSEEDMETRREDLDFIVERIQHLADYVNAVVMMSVQVQVLYAKGLDQQDLADEQNHLVGKVVRRSDLIQSGKDFRHRNSSI